MSSDHEQYLVHHYFQDQPVFVTDYPAALKPFYAKTRRNNEHTVREVVQKIFLIVRLFAGFSNGPSNAWYRRGYRRNSKRR